MTNDKQIDRERILMNIAVDTAGTVHDTMQRLAGGWTLRFTFDRPSPQFVPGMLAKQIGMPMQAGDIVRCRTNPNHKLGIAELVEWKEEYSYFLLREIGGTALCRMVNEEVDVLRFMVPSRLYTGTQFRVYGWARHKAFIPRYNPDADDRKRYGGVAFEGDQLTIWCRAHIFAQERRPKEGPPLYAQPKKFTMHWDGKTRLKDIVAAMREQGFADDFVYSPNKPTEGQAGYVKITRDDLVRVLGASR